MSSVICNNQRCKYRKAEYCGKDFIMLNAFGQCNIWFNKDGQFYGQPQYPYQMPPENYESNKKSSENKDFSNKDGETEKTGKTEGDFKESNES